MLISAKELFDYKIHAQDGEIGHVQNFLFDDVDAYRVRYVVADTGNWLFGRKVLLAPLCTGAPDTTAKVMPVALTQEQIKASPEVGSDPDISREQEVEYHDHYHWPYYWGSDPLMGAATMLGSPAEALEVSGPEIGPNGQMPDEAAPERDNHLRSVRDVMGYDLYRDQVVGKIVDVMIDLSDWTVSQFMVELTDHPDKKTILIPTHLLSKVGWQDKTAQIELPVGDLFDAPTYVANSPESVERSTEYFARKV